jgi:hypothetical protein
MEDVILIEHLQTAFENSAEWRREKANEYPDDHRNREAAAQLDALAKSVESVSAECAAQYAELCAGGDAYRTVEEKQEMIRSIGFHGTWDTAEEFINDLVERVKDVERIDESNLVADLK